MRRAVSLLLMFCCVSLAQDVKVDVKVNPLAPPKVAGKEVAKEPAKEENDPVKEDQKLIQSAGYAIDPPALVEFFRKHTVTEADKAKISALITKMGADDFDTREDALNQLAQSGVAAISLLRSALKNPDYEIVRRAELCLKTIEKVPTKSIAMAAARLLAKNPAEGAIDAMLNYLPLNDDDSVSDEIRNTFASLVLRGGKPDPILENCLEHPDVIKRGAAAEAFARSTDKPTRDRMKAFLSKEKNEEIKLQVAVWLITLGKDKELVPELIRIMGEVPQTKGWRAEEILYRLAGEDVPPISLGSDKDGREKARDEWQKWWKANGEKIDMARLDTESSFGLTIFLENTLRGMGKIVAQDASGKTKWELKAINYPTDVVVLPGQKILYAEMNRNRIVERELSGATREIWSENVMQPLSLGRLPNGTTWVVGRNGIVEFERGDKSPHKKLFEYVHGDGDVVAGARTRAGEFWLVNQGSNQIQKIDRKGVVVKSHQLPRQANYNATMEMITEDKALISLTNQVIEFDLNTGKATWTYDVNNVFSAHRLKNGNTLVTQMNPAKVTEIDKDKKKVRDFNLSEPTSRPIRVIKR